ncbi:hypothetical protein TNCV_1188951 [Trichonephila clavipes]|nr:hypothetical protein TNCV_1188951 [Trichonephila clavipes]
MLNDDEIVTSVQEESDPVDEDNNNNGSSKDPSIVEGRFLPRITIGLMVIVSPHAGGRCSQVIKVSDHGWLVTSLSPVPRKTRRVRKRCTLNLSRAQISSRWCGVVVRRGGASSGVVLVT